MITQKSNKLSKSHYRNMIRSFMNSKAITRSFLKKSLEEIRSVGRRSRIEPLMRTEVREKAKDAEQRTHNLKIEEHRISINDGLFLCSSRISVGLPLKLLNYVKAVSAAFKGRGVQMVFWVIFLIVIPGLDPGISCKIASHKIFMGILILWHFFFFWFIL